MTKNIIPPFPPPPPPPQPCHHCCCKEKVLEKLEDAITEASMKTESVRKYSASIYKKLSDIILDPSSSKGREQFSEMIDKTGKTTLIEAIVSICNKIESGEGVNITYESVINALGYVPAAEGGSNYVVGFFLD